MLAYALPLLFPKVRSKVNFNKVGKRMANFSHYDTDDILKTLGLRRIAPIAGTVAASVGLVLGGLAVGAILGMMFAPKTGRELRRTISEEGWSGVKDLGRGAIDSATAQSKSLS